MKIWHWNIYSFKLHQINHCCITRQFHRTPIMKNTKIKPDAVNKQKSNYTYASQISWSQNHWICKHLLITNESLTRCLTLNKPRSVTVRLNVDGSRPANSVVFVLWWTELQMVSKNKRRWQLDTNINMSLTNCRRQTSKDVDEAERQITSKWTQNAAVLNKLRHGDIQYTRLFLLSEWRDKPRV